jgi:hypothetical protein
VCHTPEIINNKLSAGFAEFWCSDRVRFVLQKNRFSVTPLITKTPIHLKVDTPAAVSRRDGAVPSDVGFTEINDVQK